MVIDFPLYAVKIKISRAGDYMGGVWGSPRSLRTIQLLPGEVLVDDPDFLTSEIWQRRLVEAGFQPGDVVFDDLNFPAPNFLTPEIYQRRLVERLAEAAEKSVFWLDGFTRLTLADTDLNALEKVDAYLSAFGDVIKGPRPSESAVDYAARAEQAWQAAAVARRGKTSAAKPRLREHSDWTARYYLTEARPAEIAEAAGRTLKAVEKAIAEIRSPANFRSDVRLTGPDNTYRLN